MKKIFKYLNIEISRAGGSAGFVILFAVSIASIVLAIALGIANIAYKEIKFTTSAKETNEAFFAADTGAECALYNDKSSSNSFVEYDSSGLVTCRGGTIILGGAWPSWSFVVPSLGTSGAACAKVTVTKDAVTYFPATRTTILSEGYNLGDASCNSSSPNRVEREVRITY